MSSAASSDVRSSDIEGTPDSAPQIIDLSDNSADMLGSLVDDLALVRLESATETPESLRTDAVTTAYRGGTVALVLLAAGIVGFHPFLGVSVAAAAQSALGLGLAAVLLTAAGRVHELLLRSRHAPQPDNRRSGEGEIDRGDLREQFRANERQILRYHGLALKQAESSFRHGQLAMSVALGILLLGARNRAVEQLNRAHTVPLAKTLLFVADELTRKVPSGAARSELVREVVLTTLRAVESTLAVPSQPVRLGQASRRRHGAATPPA